MTAITNITNWGFRATEIDSLTVPELEVQDGVVGRASEGARERSASDPCCWQPPTPLRLAFFAFCGL
jgi:hypothetical protein